MGAYLDRLNEQFDEIRGGIDTLVNRAAEENRDVTEAEQQQVDRDQTRLSELQTAIEHYTDLESRGAKVAELRRTVPARPPVTQNGGPHQPEAYDILREFPSMGHYAIAVHRATMLRDPEAREAIDRATAHQLTTDNPGLIPRPILGPVVNLLDTTRPFINAITRRPLPTGRFDRPVLTQHVLVGKQTGEKVLTDSQKLTLGVLPVAADTFAGHLNISRQDIKWTSPGILQIVFEDFAAMYALATCAEACADFVASVTGVAIPITTWTVADISEALYSAASDVLAANGEMFDTLFVAPDVWGRLGSLTTTQDQSAFPSISLTGVGGSPLGLRLVVDSHFPAGTMIAGPARLAEWYEDVDGLMQVGEPDVIGQLVGYAGYGAFLNVAPTAFAKFTPPAPVG